MTMPLAENQFELDGVVFGEGAPVDVSAFEPSGATVRNQDADDPNADARNMGRDLRTPGQWAFTFFTGVMNRFEDQAVAAIETLERVWPLEGTEKVAGGVRILRYRKNNRTRRVYGRPRRWTPGAIDSRREIGLINVIADFAQVDILHYDDEESSLQLTLAQNDVGGLVSPLISPLVSELSSAPRAGVAQVGGTHSTWAVVTIQGPISQPYVSGPGWEFRLNMTLAFDQTVIVDPRPWKRSINLNSGASVAGKLRGSRLYEVKMPTGAVELVFGGIDNTGTAECTVSWRSASRSI